VSGRSFIVVYTMGVALANGNSVETVGAVIAKNGDLTGASIFADGSAADGAMYQTSLGPVAATITQSQEQYADEAGSGTILIVTPPLQLIPGSLLLVEVTNDTTAPSTITVSDGDNVGDYTPIDDVTDTLHSQRVANFYFKNSASAGNPAIKATWDVATAGRGIHFREIVNADRSNPLAGHAAQFQATPGVGADGATSGNTAALTGQPALNCGFVNDAAANGTPSAGTGFTTGTSGWGFGGTDGARSETKRVTSTAAVAATFTMGANDSSVTLAAVFLEADSTTTHASLTVQRRVTLNNGDTIQPLGAKQIGNADLLIDSLSLTVIPQ
jgi:hypothetical protein